ncbi:MAG: ATP-binding protein, partial [Bacteroidales bacterium]|nr:ATP-binding protein [Bacteroidales bacterium]
GEFHNIKKNGKLYWESASISPIKDQEGLITHFVAVKEDITARKEMEAELVKAKEAAEESERLKSAFLANMSHEIRTPMNGILGFADLLKEAKLSPEEQKEYIDIIETSGRRMLSIINDLIDISKVESGQMKISLSESNINDQLSFIYNFFKLEAKQKGLDFSIHCPLENDLALIRTDREKVYAVLTNLIKNAIKFTKQGSIAFGYVVKDQMIQFYCKDTGRGIPTDKLTTVFERFHQVDTHLSNGIQGSGLGLAISKAYVEMLGGKLWVESELGVGSTFFFTLPYNSIRVTDASEENLSYSIPERASMSSSATILIAEDDPVGLRYLTELLKKYDFKLLFAENGEEAVQLCYGNEDVKMVLMDIKMPVMDGYTAAQVIKGFRSDLPIIAQTALAMEKEKYKDVFDDYLIKPINASELSEVLKKYLVKKTK